jgi:hypothetical protein
MTFNENKHIEVQNIHRNNLISIGGFFFSFFSHFWFGMVWFYGGFLRVLPVSSTNKADRHDITEI